MDITTTAMNGPVVRRNAKDNTAWVYNTKRLTGLRWCYLFSKGNPTLISCMSGNPVKDFKILEEFRPATKLELEFLNHLEVKLNGR